MADFGAYGIIPPLLAIVMAMVTRKVFQSLLLGIFSAGIMVAGASSVDAGTAVWLVPFAAMAGGFLQMVTWIVEGIAGADPGGLYVDDGEAGGWYIGHPAVIAFTVFLGALVALMQRAGGVRGFGEWFLSHETGRRSGMVFSSLGGMFLAIDDYFHVIAAGSIFRPVTDRLKISREKLSYLIDSTAAPMVILVPISTWAGYIIGEVSKSREAGDFTSSTGSFGIFLAAIPFNFYAILTVAFVLFIAFTGTDFGPMARAERRAMREGKLSADGAKPLQTGELDAIEPSIAPKARNLLLPVLFLIVTTVIVLAAMGYQAYDPAAAAAAEAAGEPYTPNDTIAKAIQGTPMPELSLAISSFLTLMFAMTYYSFQGLKQDDFTETAIQGVKAMTPALAILALAWGIGNAVTGVGLADWIAGGVAGNLEPAMVPLIAFILGSIIAFATGTSFGTFAIMIPIALPVAFATGGEQWLGPALAASIGGAVFGDHCSPISDTTVMSSMAAQADHIDHVRTQIPYALTMAAVAIAGYGMLAITGLVAAAWITNILLFGLVAFFALAVWKRSVRA